MSPRTYPQTSKSAALLFFLLHPGINSRRILETWTEHPVLSDYQQPDEKTLVVWVEEFVAFRNGFLYRGSYRKI
jgi:hypothetical protein